MNETLLKMVIDHRNNILENCAEICSDDDAMTDRAINEMVEGCEAIIAAVRESIND